MAMFYKQIKWVGKLIQMCKPRISLLKIRHFYTFQTLIKNIGILRRLALMNR